MISREHVLAHEKFDEIFKPYAKALGLDEPQSHPEWDALQVKIDLMVAEKIAAVEMKKKLDAEKAIADEKAKQDEIIINRDKYIIGYFKKIRDKNLTRLVGQKPDFLKAVLLKG
jgi:hypothetical protein